MTPPALKLSTLSADTQIIREVLLFKKFCVKTDVYWASDNTSRIIILSFQEIGHILFDFFNFNLTAKPSVIPFFQFFIN